VYAETSVYNDIKNIVDAQNNTPHLQTMSEIVTATPTFAGSSTSSAATSVAPTPARLRKQLSVDSLQSAYDKRDAWDDVLDITNTLATLKQLFEADFCMIKAQHADVEQLTGELRLVKNHLSEVY